MGFYFHVTCTNKIICISVISMSSIPWYIHFTTSINWIQQKSVAFMTIILLKCLYFR